MLSKRLSMSSLLLLASLLPGSTVYAQSWKDVVRPQQQQQQQQPSFNWLIKDQAQVNAEKQRQQRKQQEQQASLLPNYCPVQIVNPQMRGSNNEAKTFGNAFGQTASTHEHMSNYNANQRYSGNMPTYKEGGTRYGGSYSGTGAMGQDSGAVPLTREMPRDVKWP